MKKNLLKLVCLFVSLTLLISLTACGSSQSNTAAEQSQKEKSEEKTAVKKDEAKPVKKTPVRVYCAWAEAQLPNWKPLIDEYNKRTDATIEIKMEFLGSQGYHDKVKAEIMSGNPPEVFQQFKTGFNEYASAGMLKDLTDLFKSEGWYDIYNKGALKWAGPIVNEKNEIFGIPDFASTSVIFYNVNMFKELGINEPTNIDELIAVSKKLNAAGKKAIVTGANGWCSVDLFAKVQAQIAGVKPLIDAYTGKGKYTDASLLESMKIVQKLVKEKAVDPSSASMNDDDAIATFVAGGAGMYTAITAMTALLDNMAKEKPGFSYDVIKKMDFVPNPKVGFSTTWGSLWCVSKDVKNADGAYEALKFLFGENVSKDTVKKVGKIYNVEKWNEELSNPALKTAVKYHMPNAASEDSFFLIDMVSSKVFDNLMKGIQSMIQDSTTPEKVLDQAQKTWETELAQKGK